MNLDAARLALLSKQPVSTTEKEGTDGERVVQVGDVTHESVEDALAAIPKGPEPRLNAARLAFETGKVVRVSPTEPENKEK